MRVKIQMDAHTSPITGAKVDAYEGTFDTPTDDPRRAMDDALEQAFATGFDPQGGLIRFFNADTEAELLW